jgi:hypothetical protein
LTSPEVTEYDISPWDALLVSVKRTFRNLAVDVPGRCRCRCGWPH